MTGGEARRGRDPSRGTTPAAAHATTLQATARRGIDDDAWDAEMTRLLREAAEMREERESARSDQDARSARAEAAALLDAIRAHGHPHVKHYMTRPLSPGAVSARVMP